MAECGIAGEIAKATQAQIQAYLDCLEPSASGTALETVNHGGWLIVAILVTAFCMVMFHASRGKAYGIYLVGMYSGMGWIAYCIYWMMNSVKAL